MVEWPTLALFWYAPRGMGDVVDPIFGKPLNFFLFTLPAWQLIAGWLAHASRDDLCTRIFLHPHHGRNPHAHRASQRLRHIALALALHHSLAFLLLTFAMRAYVDRFERLFDDHTIFGGVTYTDAQRHADRNAHRLRGRSSSAR